MKKKILQIVTLSFFSLILGTQMGNGCVSDSGTYDDDRNRPDYNRYDNPVSIPRDARVVVEGRGVIRYRAPDDGRVYLFDADDRRVITDVSIDRGREFIVAPKDDKAWINDDRVYSDPLEDRHEHRIYFLADRGARRDDDRDRRGEEDRGDRWRDRDSDAKPSKPAKPDKPVFSEPVVVVPKSARIIREGRNTDLSFESDGAGTVYLYDTASKNIVATHRLRKGQRFTVSIRSGEAAVDGKVVFKKSLSGKVTYRLYFNLDV